MQNVTSSFAFASVLGACAHVNILVFMVWHLQAQGIGTGYDFHQRMFAIGVTGLLGSAAWWILPDPHDTDQLTVFAGVQLLAGFFALLIVGTVTLYTAPAVPILMFLAMSIPNFWGYTFRRVLTRS